MTIPLFCFAHAGASATGFVKYRRLVGPGIDVRPIELPGRGSRLGEPFAVSIEEAALDALGLLWRQLGANELYALWGHSMGALVAFELARAAARRSLPGPRHLFVSACRAPQLFSDDGSRTPPSDEELLAEIRQLGGTPAEAMAQPEFATLFLPVLRADFRLVAGFALQADDSRPLTDLTVVCGRDDSILDSDLLAWRRHSGGTFRFARLDGGHFFPFEEPGPMAHLLRETLEEPAPR